jgi:hypothetical protein
VALYSTLAAVEVFLMVRTIKHGPQIVPPVVLAGAPVAAAAE